MTFPSILGGILCIFQVLDRQDCCPGNPAGGREDNPCPICWEGTIHLPMRCGTVDEGSFDIICLGSVPWTARGRLRPHCCSVWWVVVWCWPLGEARWLPKEPENQSRLIRFKPGMDLTRIWRCSVFGSSKGGRAGGQKDRLEHRRSNSTNNDGKDGFASDNCHGGMTKCEAESTQFSHMLRTALIRRRTCLLTWKCQRWTDVQSCGLTHVWVELSLGCCHGVTTINWRDQPHQAPRRRHVPRTVMLVFRSTRAWWELPAVKIVS
jgi:hypothetical protein